MPSPCSSVCTAIQTSMKTSLRLDTNGQSNSEVNIIFPLESNVSWYLYKLKCACNQNHWRLWGSLTYSSKHLTFSLLISYGHLIAWYIRWHTWTEKCYVRAPYWTFCNLYDRTLSFFMTSYFKMMMLWVNLPSWVHLEDYSMYKLYQVISD